MLMLIPMVYVTNDIGTFDVLWCAQLGGRKCVISSVASKGKSLVSLYSFNVQSVEIVFSSNIDYRGHNWRRVSES